MTPEESMKVIQDFAVTVIDDVCEGLPSWTNQSRAISLLLVEICREYERLAEAHFSGVATTKPTEELAEWFARRFVLSVIDIVRSTIEVQPLNINTKLRESLDNSHVDQHTAEMN